MEKSKFEVSRDMRKSVSGNKIGVLTDISAIPTER